MEHFFLSSFEKIGKMTFPDPPDRENSRLFLKIFNEVFPKESPRSRLPPPDLHQQLQAGSLINIQHTGDGKPLGSTGLNSTYS